MPLTDDLYAPSGRAQQIITAPVVSAKGKARGTLSLALEFFASTARNQQPAATEKEAAATAAVVEASHTGGCIHCTTGCRCSRPRDWR